MVLALPAVPYRVSESVGQRPRRWSEGRGTKVRDSIQWQDERDGLSEDPSMPFNASEVYLPAMYPPAPGMVPQLQGVNYGSQSPPQPRAGAYHIPQYHSEDTQVWTKLHSRNALGRACNTLSPVFLLPPPSSPLLSSCVQHLSLKQQQLLHHMYTQQQQQQQEQQHLLLRRQQKRRAAFESAALRCPSPAELAIRAERAERAQQLMALQVARDESERVARAWMTLARRDIPKWQRAFCSTNKRQTLDLRRSAELCQREVSHGWGEHL